MARENYLLQRARLILTELQGEYNRVSIVSLNNTHSADRDSFLNVIKSRMIEVEEGIKMLENLPAINL
jgi:hypothetical protein